MKIFVSMKVPRGDVELEQLADLVADFICKVGHEPLIATYEIANQGLSNPKSFMPFVRQHAETCDLMIVLYHTELRGGLIELGIAYAHHIPIWLCHQPGEKISSSALGCADLTVEYVSFEELQKELTTNLSGFSRIKRTL